MDANEKQRGTFGCRNSSKKKRLENSAEGTLTKLE